MKNSKIIRDFFHEPAMSRVEIIQLIQEILFDDFDDRLRRIQNTLLFSQDPHMLLSLNPLLEEVIEEAKKTWAIKLRTLEESELML